MSYATSIGDCVCRVRADQEGAIEELYDRSFSYLRSFYLRKVKDLYLFEDLFHETFITALERLVSLNREEAYFAWITTIFRHKLINFKVIKTNSFLTGGKISPIAVTRDIAEFDSNELASHIMGKLAPKDREILALCYCDGLSYLEIKSQLRVPIGTVKRRIHTAKQRAAKIPY